MPLRDFLEIPYDKLEDMNLATKEARQKRTPAHLSLIHISEPTRPY